MNTLTAAYGKYSTSQAEYCTKQVKYGRQRG